MATGKSGRTAEAEHGYKAPSYVRRFFGFVFRQSEDETRAPDQGRDGADNPR